MVPYPSTAAWLICTIFLFPHQHEVSCLVAFLLFVIHYMIEELACSTEGISGHLRGPESTGRRDGPVLLFSSHHKGLSHVRVSVGRQTRLCF